MKKYIYTTILMMTAASAYAFEVTGDHFKANFTIDSVTVAENQATINVSSKSADVGQMERSIFRILSHLIQQ